MLQRLTVFALAVVCASALLANTAFARTKAAPPVTVSPPPVAITTAAAQLFEAMLAIARAEETYPAGLPSATTLYTAALQRYNAGDMAGAAQGAVQSIAAASRVPYPDPQAWQSPSPTVASTAPLPAVLEAGQADAESYLGIAWRALANCGATDTQLVQALRGRYGTAVQETLAHRYTDVVADARVLVTSCVPRASSP